MLYVLLNQFFRDLLSVLTGLPFSFAFSVGKFYPKRFFEAVGDGEGAVFGAFGDDALGPDAVGEVGRDQPSGSIGI
ncbi:MAG: hypothetical protein EA353_01770 [Puniceicoccaceae bacterium]|nr:MAG: hypothetical protein EA353_01770 [Puniceicoccaceae bacterium]